MLVKFLVAIHDLDARMVKVMQKQRIAKRYAQKMILFFLVRLTSVAMFIWESNSLDVSLLDVSG